MATQQTFKSDPLSTVHYYIDAFNRGDVKGMAAAFSVPGSILDGMPPHVWHGPSAAEDWYRDVLITTKNEGASNFFVTLGPPQHMDITRETAYVVVPATMKFNVHGKQTTQSAHSSLWRFRALGMAGASPRGHGRKVPPSLVEFAKR